MEDNKNEILVQIKPVMIPNMKSEFEVCIDPSKTPVDLVLLINELYEIEGNFSFLFRGKKLFQDKTLQEQGINKPGIKLLMNQNKEPLIQNKPKEIKKEHQISNQISSNKNNNINNNNQNKKTESITEKLNTLPINLTPTYQKLEKVRIKMTEKYKNNINAVELINNLVKTIPHKEEMSEEELISRIEQFLKACLPQKVEEFYLKINPNEKITIDEKQLTSIFAQGNCSSGQLGTGKFISTDIPFRVNALKKLKITQIACGVAHTIALTDNNLVYAWGRFYKPETKEKEATSGDYAFPQLLESLSNESIIKIATGGNHSMAITELGELYTWGEGIYGQLGHGINNNEQYPRKVNFEIKNCKIIDCKGGAMHTVALSNDGYLFGWGVNDKNQLNLGKLNTNEPFLIPLYEFDNNLTLEEYKFLNDEKNVNKENQGIDINQLELSKDVESLMKIDKFVCATWYTVVTSKVNTNTLFIFGNKYKRVIKIDYFQNNNIEIKQMEASSRLLYILSNDDRMFEVNIEDLLSDKIKIIEEIKINITDIEKIACGLDYFLVLNSYNQCYYFDHKIINGKQNISQKLLNEEVKCDIFDISSGATFFFLITHLNSMGFYEQLFKDINTALKGDYSNTEHYSFDILLSKENNSFIKYPCHSYLLELFIDLSKLKQNSNSVLNEKKFKEYLIPVLSNDEIMLLLELLYTSSINWENLNKNINKYVDLSGNINHILDFLDKFGKIKNLNKLKELILLYKEKIDRYINNFKHTIQILTSEEKNSEISKMLLKSYISIMRDNLNIQNQEKKPAQKKLTKVSALGMNNENAKLNIDSYKQYLLQVDYIYSFYKKIESLKNDINIFKTNYIINNLKKAFSFLFKYGKNTQHAIILNKDIISQKSKYFHNIINLLNFKEFDINDIGLVFNDEVLDCFLEYLKEGKCQFDLSKIIDILDLSSFFMCDKLFSLVTVELEQMIDYDNVLTLIEIAKDYNLNLLYNSCLVFITANLRTCRERGLVKFVQESDRVNLKRIMELNRLK